MAAIKRDAAALYTRYLQARLGAQPHPSSARRTFKVLAATWRASQAWKDNKPRTNVGYEEMIRHIEDWGASTGDPDPSKLTKVQIEAFVGLYDDRPTMKYHVRKVLRMMMEQAIHLGWRADNPVNAVKVPLPESRVVIWEHADVLTYAAAAKAAGHPDVGAIILTEWEIGQRLTDVILFRRKAEFLPDTGEFSFDQSKTGNPVAIPVSRDLRRLLAACKRGGSPYLFHDAKTGRPYRDVNRLGHVFEDVRTEAMKGGARYLVLRALRHSCVVQLARAGCTVPEIAAITGHSPASVMAILKIYLPRDSTVARNAQMKRGLIARESA